jgi:hypothetical protein
VYPEEHEVAPVQPLPPHCAYAEARGPAADDVGEVVTTFVVLEGAIVVTGLVDDDEEGLAVVPTVDGWGDEPPPLTPA